MRGASIVLVLLCWAGTGGASRAAGNRGGGDRPEPTAPPSHAAFRTTDGALALVNLQAQIAAEERLAAYGPLSVPQRVGIIELVSMRGQFLGQIADYERAEELAEQLVRDVPNDGRALLARANVRSTFHRFSEALADLAQAERLGASALRVESARAAVLQATGRYDEALVIRRRIAQARPDISSLGAEASLRADRGDIEDAERLYVEAERRYRDVSPFPIAWLSFQRGLMWMREGDLEQARAHFAAACDRLPAYAAAQGHLGEVEAALGGRERAIALLRPLAASSDDPDYAAQLARILGESGQRSEARRWRESAAARYEILVARHPEAFADHAAEFWLAAGGDAKKALALARVNHDVRLTPRADELVLQAALAAGDTAVACAAVDRVRALGHPWAGLRALASRASATCGRRPHAP